MKEQIAVFSSRAQDILINENNEVISKQDGGPILFIENALKNSGVSFSLNTGELINVEILMTNEGEFGRVPQKPLIKSIPENIDSKCVLVSTILNEWSIDTLSKFNGKLFIDIQGFVRDGNDFGRKNYWNDVRNFPRDIYCLKGTREEVGYLPKEIFEKQKKSLLVITDGSKGLEFYENGESYKVPAKEINKPKDTIGAGDTFFSYFTASLFKGSEALVAAREASIKTANFLASK